MDAPIFDSGDSFHKRPFGAVKCGETVFFSVKWKTNKSVFFVLSRDDTGTETRTEMTTDGDFIFKIRIVFDFVGLYFYHFECEDGCVLRNAPSSKGFVLPEDAGEWFTQMVYEREYISPKRFGGRIVYQIFPDRFYRKEPLSAGFDDRIIHNDLNALPLFRPVNGIVKNNDYFGGNLRGIIDKLPYLKSLGIGAIYLNPIFESHSNHRYDTADYMRVDPMLGDNNDFKRLCECAHSADILIVLDGVFSHTGADSVYFNKYGRYGKNIGAFNDDKSPWRSWYKWDDSSIGYHGWWGFETLPEVNENDTGFRTFICGEGGVIDYWLSLGADGFRLDVADELPDSFIAEIRKAVKRWGDDKILIGEVWEDAAIKIAYDVRRQYYWGYELDSVMNYPFREAIIEFVRGADSELFINRVMEIIENCPKPMMDLNLNLLSTHDTDRLLTALTRREDNHDREWQSLQWLSRDEYLRGVEMAKLAFALLLTLPGIPMIYYGDEIGMQGYSDPFNRGYFKWDDMDDNLYATVRNIIAMRRQNSAFVDGVLVRVFEEEGCIAYLRKNDESTVFVAVNRADLEYTIQMGTHLFKMPPWTYLMEPI